MADAHDAHKDGTRIGFIGLGAMGSRMAANILNGGYAMVVYNRDEARSREIVNKGAEAAASPREVAERSTTVITMLSDPAAVTAVLDGPDGLLEGAYAGLVWIDMSTVGPSEAHAAVTRGKEYGIHVLHAPVLGSLGPAQKGELTVLLGGDHEPAEAARPLLQTMGKDVRYLGANEQACVMKLAVNLLLVGSYGLFGEAIAAATRWGVPREQAVSLLGNSAAASPALKGRLDTMYDADAPGSFALRLARKDLWLAVAAGYEKGAAMPLAAAALQTLTMASRTHGDEDVSRIAAFVDE